MKIPDKIICPNCDTNGAHLIWKKYPTNILNNFIYLCYECEICGNGYITTETDTISMGKNISISNRIKKIKKIIK